MNRRLLSHQAAILCITYCAYALYHVGRKSFANVKPKTIKTWSLPDMPENTSVEDVYMQGWSLSKHEFCSDDDNCREKAGALDLSFSISYALGIYFWGHLGDRIDPRLCVSIGLFASGWVLLIFGFIPERLEFFNLPYLVVWWVVFGFFQACGYPNVVSILGNWIGKRRRGIIMGIWGSCLQAGNIIAGNLSSVIVVYGLEYVYMVNACLLWTGMCFMLVGIVTWPEEVGMPSPNETVKSILDVGERRSNANSLANSLSNSLENLADEKQFRPKRLKSVDSAISMATTASEEEPHHRQQHQLKAVESAVSMGASSTTKIISGDVKKVEKKKPQSEEEKPIGLLAAILLPGVIPSALALACVKLVDYSFFFWLAYYLSDVFKWPAERSAPMSTAYDAGGLVGGVFFGLLSDLLGVRTPVLTVMLIVASGVIFVFSTLTGSSTLSTVIVVMVFSGFSVSGAANMIQGAVAADLGRQKALEGKSTKALSTVTGIIDGTGSFGSALGQLLVPLVVGNFGWQVLYLCFVAFLLIAALCLVPVTYRECKEFWQRFKQIRFHVGNNDLSWKEVVFGEDKRRSREILEMPQTPRTPFGENEGPAPEFIFGTQSAQR